MFGDDSLIEPPEFGPTAAGGATWIENWFRPTITATMLTCLVVALTGLLSRIVAGWRGPHYIVFAFLVSWEGIQSERLLRRRGPAYSGHLRYRAVEALLILVLFRLIRDLPLGWDALWASVRRWWADVNAFLDVGFYLGGMGILVLWVLAIAITKRLYQLEVHPSEMPPDPASPTYDRWASGHGQRVDRQAVLGDIVHWYFMGGVGLLLFTGLARFDIPALYPHAPPPLSGLVVNALVYFALGLALISQAHFSILQAFWRLGRIEVSSRLGTRWAWLAFAFLALIMLLALALPTGYSLGLPQAISFLVTTVVGAVSFVFSTLFYLISLLFGLLLSLLGMQQKATALPRPTLAPPPSFAPSTPGTASNVPWFEVLKSVLFWGIFLAIVAYSVYHFFRERRGLFPGFEGRLLGRLFAWLRGLWRRTRHWSAQARKTIVRRLSQRTGLQEPAGLLQVVRLSRLSPRQRVRYFYLSILRRADRIDHGRLPQQTPYEYGTRLAEDIPEVAPDMATLTQAFVEARYSQRSPDEQRANVIKKIWRRARAALARRRRSRQHNPSVREESGELAG
jgi:hypothetical protein